MAVPGNVNPNQNIRSATFLSNAAENKANVKESIKEMGSLMKETATIRDDLKNQQFVKLGKAGQKSEMDSSVSKALDQLKQQNQEQAKQVLSQSKSQQSQLSQGKEAEQLASVLAGLEAEEELGETNELLKSLEEKMEIMMKHAEKLQDVELENPDDNYELQQMFSNVDKMKQLKQRESHLDKKLEDIDITLKQQETRETLNKLPVDESTDALKKQLDITYADDLPADDSDAQRDSEQEQDDSEKSKDTEDQDEQSEET